MGVSWVCLYLQIQTALTFSSMYTFPLISNPQLVSIQGYGNPTITCASGLCSVCCYVACLFSLICFVGCFEVGIGFPRLEIGYMILTSGSPSAPTATALIAINTGTVVLNSVTFEYFNFAIDATLQGIVYVESCTFTGNNNAMYADLYSYVYASTTTVTGFNTASMAFNIQTGGRGSFTSLTIGSTPAMTSAVTCDSTSSVMSYSAYTSTSSCTNFHHG